MKAFSVFLGGKFNRGMSYVELIVVLSIFSVMTSVIIFNYGEFQAKVDVKNLASDIALKIVEAQKSSVSGRFPPSAQQSLINSTWKPAYGFFLDRVANNKSFIYFTDIDQDNLYDSSSCPGVGECLEQITITNGNNILNAEVFFHGVTAPTSLNDLTIAFKRPNSDAVISSSQIVLPLASPISHVQITVASTHAPTAQIKIYPSGRIQVN